jgi:glucose/arabinose dehydrogenase
MPSKLFSHAIAASVFLGASLGQAQTYTDAFPGVTFDKPVWFGEIPGKPGHFLVLEQHEGNIALLRKQGADWIKESFHMVGVNRANEMGLLGLAFHPGFAENRKFYINYNPASGGMATVIEERTADATFLKDAGTGRVIMRIPQPYVNHNGGSIAFGPEDGFLYIGTGDGGSGNDPDGNAQDKNSLLGKMLRIDVDNKADGKEYAIPSDNPFAATGGAPEIYAWGLRNPWKWSFDPPTGDLWVADVGQGFQEEVDIVIRGGDYGWKNAEGYRGNTGGIIGPVFAYGRDERNGPDFGTSITGGFVFRGSPSSKFHGQFIVGDYNSRQVWALKSTGYRDSAEVVRLQRAPDQPSSFGMDSKGHLYLVGHANGKVYRFDGPDWQPAPAASRPQRGHLERAIGCIFSCRPGARLDPRAFEAGVELEIRAMSGKRMGGVTAASGEVPAGLEAGMYVLIAAGKEASAKPNLLLVR